MLIVDFYISENFISDVQTQRFHLLISSRNSNGIHQKAFIVAGNKLLCLGQVPSRSLFCSSLDYTNANHQNEKFEILKQHMINVSVSQT